MKCRLILVALAVTMLVSGCAAPKGATVAEKKAYALSMRDEALATLYTEEPGIKARVEAAPGYAVVSGYGQKLLLLGFGNGYAVVHDNATGKDTHSKMFHISIGPGIGFKSFRGVYILNDKATVASFGGSWRVVGEAEAAARFPDKGGEAGAAGVAGEAVDYAQYTSSGIMLQAAIVPRKHWTNKELK